MCPHTKHLLQLFSHAHSPGLPNHDVFTVENKHSLASLSPSLCREIKLTLPALTLEDSSDLRELLADMELPALLGKGADFSKISNASITVGKVQYYHWHSKKSCFLHSFSLLNSKFT